MIRRTKTVHIAEDVHRVLKQMAAYEGEPLEALLDRVLRFALNLPTDTSQGRQLDLTAIPAPGSVRRTR